MNEHEIKPAHTGQNISSDGKETVHFESICYLKCKLCHLGLEYR